METISLFPVGTLDPVESKADKAVDAIRQLLVRGHPLVIAYSGGKDSSMVAALALHAAVLHRAAGGTPLVVVTTGDTLVESRISKKKNDLAEKFSHDGQSAKFMGTPWSASNAGRPAGRSCASRQCGAVSALRRWPGQWPALPTRARAIFIDGLVYGPQGGLPSPRWPENSRVSRGNGSWTKQRRT